MKVRAYSYKRNGKTVKVKAHTRVVGKNTRGTKKRKMKRAMRAVKRGINKIRRQAGRRNAKMKRRG